MASAVLTCLDPAMYRSATAAIGYSVIARTWKKVKLLLRLMRVALSLVCS